MVQAPWERYAQGVQTKPADPRIPYQLQQEQGQAAAAQYAAPKAQADVTIAQANAANAGSVAASEAEKARADAEKARFELEKLKTEQVKVDPKSGAYAALQTQIDRVSELYRQNLQGGVPNVLSGNIPDWLRPENGQFESSAQGLVNPFMAAFRIPGVGAQSDLELKQFLASNTPNPGDSDLRIEEKLGNIQRRLDAEKGAPRAAAPDRVDRSSSMVAGDGSQRQVALSSGMRDEVDPVLKGVGAKVSQMLATGKSDAEIVKFLGANGVDPGSTSISDALMYRRTPEFKAWQRQNPGKPYPLGPNFYTKQVPMSGAQSLGNIAAQSAPAAMAIGSAQALTGNRLDNIASALGGDGEAINTGIELSRANSPNASFAGDVSGQIMFDALLNKVPGLSKLGKFKGVGEDAAYGGFAGSGDENSSALGGILANTLGGAAGRGGQGAVGGLLKGVSKPNLNYLNDRAVPLTIGQIGRGSGSTFGEAVAGIEDRLAGFPIADAIIGTARRRGDEGFNAAGFREMGGSGLTGAAGITEGKGLVKNAFGFLDGANFPIDAQFAGSQAGVRAGLGDLPAFGREIGSGMDTIDRAAGGGSLAGRDWRSAISATRGDRSSIAGQPFSQKAVGALGDVEGNLMDLAGRQGDPGTLENLIAANKMNAQFQTLVSALDNGPAQRSDELFSASRLNDASRAGARNYGGRVASMEGKRPFYDLTTAGMDVMPNLTPDSGTAGRSLLYAGALGAGVGGVGGGAIGASSEEGNAGKGAFQGGLGGAATTLTPALLLAALYSKGGQKGLQKALLGPRPAIFDKALTALNAGNPLSKAAKKAISRKGLGSLGSGASRDFFLYPEQEY